MPLFQRVEWAELQINNLAWHKEWNNPRKKLFAVNSQQSTTQGLPTMNDKKQTEQKKTKKNEKNNKRIEIPRSGKMSFFSDLKITHFKGNNGRQKKGEQREKKCRKQNV